MSTNVLVCTTYKCKSDHARVFVSVRVAEEGDTKQGESKTPPRGGVHRAPNHAIVDYCRIPASSRSETEPHDFELLGERKRKATASRFPSLLVIDEDHSQSQRHIAWESVS